MSAGPTPPDITQVLNAAASGDREAAERLLPLIYNELRRLAQDRLRKTPPGNTLQPTALVHEAYLRLIRGGDPGWDGRHHFFGAAARAMRDIFVEQARRKASLKRGGDRERVPADAVDLVAEMPPSELLALNEALDWLERTDPRKAEVVMLKFFGGLTNEETAAALELSVQTIEREWRFARTLLYTRLNDAESNG